MSTPATLADKLRELLPRVTPGPWAVESCGEKGDGAHMIGVVFAPADDPECKNQLSGSLPDCDDDGDFIEYYRDELVAECDLHNRNPGYDSELIALAPTMAEQIIKADDELRRAEREIAELKAERKALIKRLADKICEANLTLIDRAEAAEREIARLKREIDAAEKSRDDQYFRAEAAKTRLLKIAELARRINSSGGYTLEERLDRILTIARSGEEPA